MRLRIGIAAAGAALLAVGVAAGAPSRPVVLGVSWEGNGMLARLDARTLAPVGRRIDIGAAPTGLVARSPAGRTIALGHGSVPELRFVDLKTMRATGRLRLPGFGSVLYGIWPAPDRLIVLRAGDAPEVFVVDPRARRVRSRLRLEGEVAGAVSTAGKLVVLLAPQRTIGPARLAVVSNDGAVRTTALPGITAGFAPPLNEETPGRQASPGLAVAPTGKRAAVVSPDTLLDIDLDTLEVRREPLSVRSPARVGKWIDGWGRGAVWTGDDTIAVSGWSYALVGKQPTQSTIAVRLVDMRTGSGSALDPTAAWVTRVGDTLLAFGGPALRGYRLDGTLRFELLAGEDSGYVQIAGRYAYVGSGNSTRFVVVDTRAGQVLGTVRTDYPTIVLG
jgi:hypothetical protein